MITFSPEEKFVKATLVKHKGHGIIVNLKFSNGVSYEIGAAGGKSVNDRWLRLIEVAYEKAYNRGKG